MYTNYKTLLEEIKTDPEIESYRGFFRKKNILLKWYSYSSYQFVYSLQFLADFNNPLLLHKWTEVLALKGILNWKKQECYEAHISLFLSLYKPVLIKSSVVLALIIMQVNQWNRNESLEIACAFLVNWFYWTGTSWPFKQK